MATAADTANVFVTVTPVNDAPVVDGRRHALTVAEDSGTSRR